MKIIKTIFLRLRRQRHISYWFAALAVLLVMRLSFADSVLPEPPKIGSTTFSEDDPIAYLVEIIRYIIVIGLTIIVVFALIGFSGGLISEVNEARRKGEWGRFSIYFGAGILVILVVIFGAWWGSERLTEILNI